MSAGPLDIGVELNLTEFGVDKDFLLFIGDDLRMDGSGVCEVAIFKTHAGVLRIEAQRNIEIIQQVCYFLTSFRLRNQNFQKHYCKRNDHVDQKHTLLSAAAEKWDWEAQRTTMLPNQF